MANVKPLPNTSTLWELFDLNPLTGELIWKVTLSSSGPSGSTVGGACTDSDGYKRVGIHGKSYRLHRIIYKWLTGKEPGVLVEHKLDNPLDNRPWMLIDSTHRKNCDTKEKLAGKLIRGISADHGKFTSSIWIENHKYHLGIFNTEEEAGEAYDLALQTLTKNPNWIPHPTPGIGSSPHRGVSIVRRFNPPKWKAQIYINGKAIYLGTFDNEDDAADAVKRARE